MKLLRTCCTLCVLTTTAPAMDVALVNLTPVVTEWGTEPHELFATNGVRVVDWGSAGNMGRMWPGSEVKIVKTVEPTFRLPEGKKYSSDMTNVVAVAGEWKTGVSLYARRMSFYHWLEYNIPDGATKFSGELFVTDDPRGYQWWGTANQQFTFQAFVDGNEVAKVGRTRTGLDHGSGELLQKLELTFPAGAKKLRFRVANSAWGDGNSNVELLLHNGRFTP